MDITLTCQDCGQEFVWTEPEQNYYRQNNLPEPKYCLICRGKYDASKRDRARFQKKDK